MKVTYKKFEDPAFLGAMGKVSNHKSKKYLTKRIGRFLADFRSKYEIYLEEKEELQHDYGKKDKNGELIKIKDQRGLESIDFEPGQKALFQKGFKEFLKKEIEFLEFRESWIVDCNINNGEFSAIMPILELDLDDDDLEKESEKESEKEKDTAKK